MKRKLFVSALICLFVLVAGSVQAVELPPPPNPGCWVGPMDFNAVKTASWDGTTQTSFYPDVQVAFIDNGDGTFVMGTDTSGGLTFDTINLAAECYWDYEGEEGASPAFNCNAYFEEEGVGHLLYIPGLWFPEPGVMLINGPLFDPVIMMTMSRMMGTADVKMRGNRVVVKGSFMGEGLDPISFNPYDTKGYADGKFTGLLDWMGECPFIPSGPVPLLDGLPDPT